MSIITKILIAEHDPHDLELMHYELNKSGIQYISETVINEKDFRNAIENFIPDLILSDYTFPSFNGITAFGIKEKLAPETPFIFVSGTIGEEKSVELIKSGVTDYVLKDRLFTLAVKIKRALKESGKKREKANADRAFQKALNEYQKIMDSSLDVICTIDEEGKFVNLSSASERVFGFKPGELKGRKYIDLVFADDVENTNLVAASIMQGTPVTFFENRYTRKDGSLVPIIWSATWDDNDKLNYCIAKDATEKKQLEKAFETERQRFFDLFLQAPSCIGILKGTNHVFEMANPLYLQLIGKTHIVGKAVQDVLPEVVGQGFIEILDGVYNTGKTFSASEMLVQIDKEGNGEFTDLYLDFIYQAYKNGAGSIEGIFFFINDVTEHVVLRKKIEESENRFRTMIEKSGDMLTLSDNKGNLIYGTPSITKILGYSFEEFKNKSAMGFIHPDDVPCYVKKRSEILQTPGASFANEQRVEHKNGNWIWCESHVTNMLHEPGINAFVSNFKDISERKIAEQRQEFDKSNLDALINSTNDLMWSVDGDFKLITSNQPFDSVIALATGNAIAKGENILKEGFPTEQIHSFKIAYERAFTGETFSVIEHIETPVESWSEVSYCPIRSGEKVIGVACHLRDISVIKKAEKQAVYSEKRFRALVEHGTDGVIILSPAGKFEYVSPSIKRLLGYTEEEAMQLDMFSLFHPDQLAGTAEVWQQVMENPGIPIPGYPIQMLHKNGTWPWLEATITNMLNDPSVNGIVDNYRDVTERVKAEQQREFDQNNLNALINNTKDLMWSVDRNFKLITSNKPFNDAIILTSGRSIAKGDSILDPDFSSKQTNLFKRVYERAFEGKSFTEIIYSGIPVETWSEISYSPINKGSKIIGVACHSRDITQLKTNERTIKDERILLRTLIDNLPAIIYTKDVYSRKTLANQADYQHMGVESEEEVLGKDDSYFFSKEDAWDTALEEQQIFYSGQPIINKEEHQQQKDGTITWFLKSKIPLKNQHNEIVGLVGISHDITERKKAEQQLQKSEAFNRGVLNSLSSHIAVIDAAGNIVAVNEAWKQFGIQNGATSLQRTAVGSNYYHVCIKSGADGIEKALEVLQGMKDVMDEKINFFNTEYPCHSPNEQRWFSVRAMKFESDEPMIVVAHQNITERKIAEENLLRSESKLLEAQAIAHIGNWEVDMVTNMHSWSDQFYKIFGINRGDLLPSAEGFESLVYPEDVDHARREMQKAFENLKASSINFRFIQKDGTLKYAYSEWRFEFDTNNKPVRLYGVIQDITERKQAEEALSLTQFAVDNAGDAIFWMEPDARIVNTNKAACQLLNYTKEEILTLSVPDIDPYYNPERWLIQFEELRQERSLFFETTQRAKDGRLIPVEIRTTYIKFGDKEFNCAFVRDITARKKAQKYLLKSEAGLKEAQAIAKIGNWEVDLENNIHTWSDEYCNILKITKEEAHPSLKYYLSFVHPEDIDHVKKVIQENQDAYHPVPYEFRFIRKDGVIRYGYAQSRFEFDKNNKPVRLYGVIQDITERKLAEFKLEHQNKELVKANFELDRFVYSVSHELRAPLTSVMGLLTFIEEESKEAYILEYAGMIKNSINRLDSFIRNVLGYSRNNRIEPEVKEIFIQKSVNEIVDSLRHMKEAEGIHFEVNIQEHVPFCSDTLTFCAIMENFISNAIKFQQDKIHERYIKITGHSDKYNLHIHIKDNGIGIPSKYHDDIFKMFFRLSGKTGGSGLGLYIVKQMINKLHGSVNVNSKEGEGTSFIITLKNLAR